MTTTGSTQPAGGAINDGRPYRDKYPATGTGDLGLFSPKSPAVMVLAFMRTAPNCCCSHVPALLPIQHPSFEVSELYVQRLPPGDS
jgi:hypothetical protein